MTIDIEVPGPNVSCVMMDDIKAFDELNQYLIDMGHRKIVVVHGRKLAMVSMQRLVGAYQAMQRNGLELPRDNIIYTNFGREEARDGVKEYFRTHSPDSATAFLCMSDMLAIGTIEGLKELAIKCQKTTRSWASMGWKSPTTPTRLLPPLTRTSSKKATSYSPTVRYDPRKAQGTAAGIAPHPDGARQRPPPIKPKSAVKAAFFRQRYENVFAATS